MLGRVYVHIGLPKTGTSYPAKDSVAQPSRTGKGRGLPARKRRLAQRYAVWDLLG